MFGAAVGIASAALFAYGAAQAGPGSPLAPAPPPPPCAFDLSVAPPGDGGVAATVRSTGCAPLAVPYSAVACLQAGDDVATCAQARDGEPARVVVPFLPGAVYTATGRGCAGWVGLPPAPDCQLLGPEVSTP